MNSDIIADGILKAAMTIAFVWGIVELGCLALQIIGWHWSDRQERKKQLERERQYQEWDEQQRIFHRQHREHKKAMRELLK